ncbi:MAG: translocation/assembly module TamB [bacterium]|nr:translocation/assembly module TamB [bacterium]
MDRTGLAQSILLRLVRKLIKFLKWSFLITVLLIIIVILVTLSPYGQYKVADLLENFINTVGEGKCQIDRVRLYQWPRITITNIHWTYHEQSVIKCSEIDVKFHFFQLFQRKLHLQYLTLSNLDLHIIETETGWNIEKLFTKKDSKKPYPRIGEKKKSELWFKKIIVDELQIIPSSVECSSTNPKYQFAKTPVTVKGSKIQLSQDQIHLHSLQFYSYLFSFQIYGDFQFQKPFPVGYYKFDLSIPDSTITRFLPSWKETKELLVTIQGNSTKRGVDTEIECTLPYQKLKAHFFSPDQNFDLIQADVELLHINLAKLVPKIDSTNIQFSVKGTIFGYLKNPRFIGDVEIKNTQIPPLSNLNATIAAQIEKNLIRLEGNVQENHADIHFLMNVNNILKPNASATLELLGTAYNFKSFLPFQEIKDTIDVELFIEGKGNKLPIDSIRYHLITKDNLVYGLNIDTLAVKGSLFKNHIRIDSLLIALAKGFVFSKGEINLSGEMQFNGYVNNVELKEINSLLKEDSISGKVNGWYNFQLVTRGEKKLVPIFTLNGSVNHFKTKYAKIDTLKVNHLSMVESIENLQFHLELDSMRTTFLSPQKIEIHGNVDSNLVHFAFHANSDTLKINLNTTATIDQSKNKITLIPETLFVHSKTFPIYVIQTSPIIYQSNTIHCEQLLLDSPFGFIATSFHLDSLNNFTSQFRIDNTEISSLLLVQPKFQELNGMASFQGSIHYNAKTGLNGDLFANVNELYWNNIFLSDSIKMNAKLKDSSLTWKVFAYREDTQIVNSDGKIVLKPKNELQIQKASLQTTEIPSRWFLVLLPKRAIWDGSIRINMDYLENREPQTDIRLVADRLSLPEFGIDQKNMIVHIRSIGEQLIVDTAYSKSGRGDIRIGGNLFTKTLIPDSVDLFAKARRFRFIKMTNRELTGDLDLGIKGKLMDLRINGRVHLLEAKYGFGEEKKELEEVFLEEDYAPLFPSNELWNNSSGTLTIVAPSNVWIMGSGINAETKLNITMNKLPKEQFPQLFGTVEIIRGTVTQYGRKLKIQEGYFIFDGEPFDPKISIKATEETLQRTMNITISLELSGSAQNPNVQLKGYYPNGTLMSEIDVVSCLVVGRPTASLLSESNENETISERATTTATTTATSQITNVLGQKLGLSIFEYRPSDNASFQKMSGELEVGGYITDRIFLSAVTPMGSTSLIDKIRAEYQVKPWLRISVSRDADGKQSLESYIQTEWGPPPVPKQDRDTKMEKK